MSGVPGMRFPGVRSCLSPRKAERRSTRTDPRQVLEGIVTFLREAIANPVMAAPPGGISEPFEWPDAAPTARECLPVAEALVEAVAAGQPIDPRSIGDALWLMAQVHCIVPWYNGVEEKIWLSELANEGRVISASKGGKARAELTDAEWAAVCRERDRIAMQQKETPSRKSPKPRLGKAEASRRVRDMLRTKTFPGIARAVELDLSTIRRKASP
jgi:hypothetical protein